MVEGIIPGQNLPQTTWPEVKGGIKLPKITLELQNFLKMGTLVDLEIMFGPNETWQATLQTKGQTYELPIEAKLAETLADGNQRVTIPVRVSTGGQLVVAEQKAQVFDKVQREVVSANIGQRSFENIEVAPLKVIDFIKQALQQKNIPQAESLQIVKDIGTVQVSLQNVGEAAAAPEKMLAPLLRVFEQEYTGPKDIPVFRQQIMQALDDLTGNSLKGEVIRQVRETTWLKTPVGETFFESKIKIPLAETVSLNIERITARPEIKSEFFEKLFQIFTEKKEISLSPEIIKKSPVLKNFAEAAAALPETSLPAVVNKLPFVGNTFLQNIYNFYQAAEKKDVSLWLGEAVVKDIKSNTSLPHLQGREALQEIENFVSTSFKETPTWKIVEVPFFNGDQGTQIKIAVKKDSQKNSKETQRQKNGTRFVVETNFSKLGSFQFDGFSNALERRLDLIVRTDKPQKDDFCSEMMNLFKKTLHDVDYVGTIKINQKETFVNLMEDIGSGEGIYI